MKVRVYHNQSQIVAIEHDLRYTENGGYTNDFHPGQFLKDQSNPSLGYENVPDWFVVDGAGAWRGKPHEYLEVRTDDQGNRSIYFDAAAYQSMVSRAASVKSALGWKRDILIQTDWTSTPLAPYERKIIIGLPLTEDENTLLVDDWTANR